MAIVAMVTYVTLGAAYAILDSRLQEMGLPPWMVVALTLAVAIAIGGFFWRVLPEDSSSQGLSAGEREVGVAITPAKRKPSIRAADDPTRAMFLGTIVFGALGVAGGIVGPGLVDPGANSLLFLITGPLGAGAGSAIGWFWWATYRSTDEPDEDAG